MKDKIFELKHFKDFMPLEIDIANKELLVYHPVLAPTELKKSIEPSLAEEDLYKHMRDNSNWSFSFAENREFYKSDCIDFLRDTDFQSFSQYGKLTNRQYLKAKRAYLFDSYLRNFLQEILERIEIFLKKSTSDAITIGYNKPNYIFEDDDLYYAEGNKYSKTNPKRTEQVLKTKYHLSRLILEKKEDSLIQNQINEYGVVLPWTVFRFMTFGNIASFLVALQPKYRNKVADYISMRLKSGHQLPAKLLLSWCNSLRYLRNLCSHNSRLYQRFHTTPPKIHHIYKTILNEKSKEILDIEKTLFVYFLIMKHIVSAMSSETQKFWQKKLDKLKEESRIKEVELEYYGFPMDWYDLLKIQS
ncbi:Abortive infection bacteriophage resistance protein [Streptococcus sp. DD11]|uniref:Abi family protein n=1 Tax=Streptococcus sp. DD11 TaxID=1777879 RepID=UPI0007970DC1|nr:Abi family protein [Streptococcus sp. DD11]KXT84527.1 Abortive infection bacteriophage resistance protein [Streptococcus sp. DD11]